MVDVQGPEERLTDRFGYINWFAADNCTLSVVMCLYTLQINPAINGVITTEEYLQHLLNI